MKTVRVEPEVPRHQRFVHWLREEGPSTAPLVLVAGIVLYLLMLRELQFGSLAQLVAGWAILAVLFAIAHLPMRRGTMVRLVFLLLATFLTLRYMWWRTFETLIYTGPLDALGMSLLYLAEVYSVAVHLLALFVNAWPIEREPVPLPADRSTWPTVDVFIPTYSEPDDIVRLTAMAAGQIDYPRDKLRIHILDDGGTIAKRAHPESGMAAWERRYRLQQIAREAGAQYHTRESNRSAKAGNLNHALAGTSGELILFLDCDHVPASEILRSTVGHFVVDPKVFLVQTPHFFANEAPAERSFSEGTGSVPDESEMFYRVIHPGLDSWNASYFCGSAAVMRRVALDEVGGISGVSITEDAETAFELHRRGWRSVYLNRPMVCGIAPERYSDYVIQHTRWAQGMVQILVLHNPLFTPGLSLAQRLCYLNCCIFWFFGVARVLYFLAPIAFLLFGLSIYHASAMQVLAYAMPYVVSTFVVTDFLFGGTRRMFFSEIYESLQSVFLAPAVLHTLRHPHHPTFKVTPKGQGMRAHQLHSLSLLFFGIAVLNMVGLVCGVVRMWAQPEFRAVIGVTMGWSVYNVYLALVSMGALWERPQLRQHHRLVVAGEGMVQFPRPDVRLTVELLDLSLSGMSFKATLPFEPRDRERMTIEVAGADGLVNYFEGELRRIVRQGEGYECGVRFIVPRESQADVVRFVYGDGARWTTVWQVRTRSTRLAALLWHLTHMGVRGAGVCGLIAARTGWKGLRTAWHASARFARREKT